MKIHKFKLNIVGISLIMLRAQSEDKNILEFLIWLSLGDGIENSNEVIVSNLKQKLKPDQAKSILSSYHVTRKMDQEIVSLEDHDFELLMALLSHLNLLSQAGNSGIIAKYADAIHGLPDAIQSEKLSRSKFYKNYFSDMARHHLITFDHQLLAMLNNWRHL